MMRFAIIGTGSIGQRHLKNLRALGHETVVFDTDRRRAEEAAAISGADILPNLEAGADAKLDGVLVCTPPVSHLPLARVVLPWGSHLFIEKPVAAESADVSEVVKPITFYLSKEIPEKWRSYLKQGVEDWAPAFEKAGFKNAIVCKDPPSRSEDPNWDPEDARHSVIR